MKWNKQWIIKQPNYSYDIFEQVVFDKDAIESLKLIDLKDVVINGKAKMLQDQSQLIVELTITGSMILACALTLEDVEYPFHINSSEVFSFIKVKEDEDIHEVKKDIVDITPIVFQLIMLEVPSRVVKDGAKIQKEGIGWKVINEKEIQKEDVIDPRLAKLQNYFIDKE